MKRVSAVKWLLLPYVTFGIYPLVVWVRMTKNYNNMARAAGQKTIMGYIPQLLLGCITFGIVPIVWIFKFFGLMSKLNKINNAGVTPANGFVMFLMSYIPIYSFFWMASAHNKLIDAHYAAQAAKAAETAEVNA